MSRSWMLVAVIASFAAFALFVSSDEARRRGAGVAARPAIPPTEIETAGRPPPACEPGGTLRVAVTSDRDGSPAPGVRVEVVAFEDRSGGRRTIGGFTDERGVVALERVPGGPVRIFAADASLYWRVDPGQENEVDLALLDGGAATVLVMDGRGVPIPGADVWVSGPGSRDRGFLAGSTGADGRFALKHVGRGRWLAARTAALGWSDRQPLDGGDDEASPPARHVAVVLSEPARSIRGAVVDAAGRALPDAWVACRRASETGAGPPVVEAATDREGAFVVDGLGPGVWTVEAWSEERAPASGHVTVGAAQDEAITLVLGPGVSVEGRVTDDSGRPLARVEVAALSEELIARAAQTMTSVDGRFRLDHLPATVLSVRAGYLAGDCVKASLDPGVSDRLVWNPVLRPGRVLAGVVRDERGSGRPFARVRAESVGEKRSWFAESITDREGCFEIANTPEGPFAVAIDVARWGDGGTWRLSGVRPGPDPLVIVIPDSARPSSYVTGRVASPEGEPLAGLVVTASRTPGPPECPVASRSREPDGSYRIGPLAPGDYLIEVVSTRGSRLTLAECTVSADDELNLGDRRVPRGGFLKVFVRREAAAPESQRLSVLDRWERSVTRLLPVAGFATSGPLAPGSYVLRIGGAGVVPGDLPFEIAEGETTTIEVPIRGMK